MHLQRLSSLGRNHFSCLIAFFASLLDLRLSASGGTWDLLGAAMAQSLQRPPSVKAMSSLVFPYSPSGRDVAWIDIADKLLQYNYLSP